MIGCGGMAVNENPAPYPGSGKTTGHENTKENSHETRKHENENVLNSFFVRSWLPFSRFLACYCG
jgi:hypothetical protein